MIVLSIMGFVVFRVIERAQNMKNTKKNRFKGDKSQVVPVESAKPQIKNIDDVLSLTGDIKGLNVASVLPKVPGKLMKKIKEVGEAVKKGESIALIDRDEPALKFEPADVTSPLDGIITRYFLDLGQNVTPATPICEIAELSPVKVVVYVTEKDLPRVKNGQNARFTNDAYPGQVFTGKVSKISESLDLSTRSSEVEIFADNPNNQLKPGMFARVGIILGIHTNAVVIPKKAVEQSMENYFVYLIKNRKAVHKQVRPGLVFEDEIEIVSGLGPEDEVITVGWHNVNEGSEVETVQS